MKMSFPKVHAKAQRRKGIWISRSKSFFAPLRLCASFGLLFFTVSTFAQTTNALSGAEIEGHALAQKILTQAPADNFTNTGILKIKDANGVRSEIPVECKTIVTATNWQTIYKTSGTNRFEILWVIHTSDQASVYFSRTNEVPTLGDIPLIGNLFRARPPLTAAEISAPFAGSDFSRADLGLEFFHWPQQQVLKKEFYRQCSCTVLESTNPNPSPNSYSRVVSWVDQDSLGIVEAYAYDANGKKLKDFYPKDFKKVNGQWQVQTLVMENLQTGSRSRLEFDLKQ